MAAAMGIETLTEEQYQKLQELGNFDTKTSSRLETPPEIRESAVPSLPTGAITNVFVYHNGADLLWQEGFCGLLRVRV